MSANTTSSASGDASGGGGSGSGGGGGPCGACKFLRRKCAAGCVFAPYFDSEQGAAHFAAVHKVFGASNVSKMLLHIPVHKRPDAVVTICYEAQARLRDPVYGCVAHIFALQQQVVNLQAELSYLQAHLTTLELPTDHHPAATLQPQPLLSPLPQLSLADLPTASSLAATTYDMSSFNNNSLGQPSWTIQQRQTADHRQFGGTGRAVLAETEVPGGGGGELQELARELLHRHESVTVPCTETHSLLPHHSS